MGRTPHLPAAGETVKGTVFKMGPGGRGFNQGGGPQGRRSGCDHGDKAWPGRVCRYCPSIP